MRSTAVVESRCKIAAELSMRIQRSSDRPNVNLCMKFRFVLKRLVEALSESWCIEVWFAKIASTQTSVFL